MTVNFTLTAAASIQVVGSLSASGAGLADFDIDSFALGDFVLNASSSTVSAVKQTLKLAAGSYAIDFAAGANSGSASGSASADLTLTIGTAKPPAITSANNVTFRLGQPSNFLVTTTGDPTPGIKETGFLPDGITFVDNGNGTATISGTPNVLDAIGDSVVTLTASNGIAVDATHPAANQFFTLTLAPALVQPVLPATHLVISTEPHNANAGSTIGTVTVLVEDKLGNVVVGNSSTVTLTLAGTAGGVLNGTLTAAASNGVATFGNLTMTKAGTYSVTASDPGLGTAKSTTFIISPDATTAHLVLTQSPVSPVLVGAKLTAMSAIVEDQFNNLIQNNNSVVTAVVAGGPSNGTVSGTTSVAIKNGVVSFKNLLLTRAGNYTLQLSDGGLPGNAPSVSVQATQGTAILATPHPAKSYKTGISIPFSFGLKSNLSKVIPFSGTVNITDKHGNVLGTMPVGATGALQLVLVGLVPGVYVCEANYSGDANHVAAVSGTFTLNVTA